MPFISIVKQVFQDFVDEFYIPEMIYFAQIFNIFPNDMKTMIENYIY